jgi:hypothetical protein
MQMTIKEKLNSFTFISVGNVLAKSTVNDRYLKAQLETSGFVLKTISVIKNHF